MVVIVWQQPLVQMARYLFLPWYVIVMRVIIQQQIILVFLAACRLCILPVEQL